MPAVWTIADPMEAPPMEGTGRVGVAPATVTMVIPMNGSPQVLPPLAPGVPALPSQWQSAPYVGYLPVRKGWLTPGLGIGETVIGEYPVTMIGDSEGGRKLQIRTILGVAAGAVLAGLVGYASLKAAGAPRAWAGGLVAGGGAAVIGGGLAVMLSWAEGAPTMQDSVLRAAFPVGVALAR